MKRDGVEPRRRVQRGPPHVTARQHRVQAVVNPRERVAVSYRHGVEIPVIYDHPALSIFLSDQRHATRPGRDGGLDCTRFQQDLNLPVDFFPVRLAIASQVMMTRGSIRLELNNVRGDLGGTRHLRVIERESVSIQENELLGAIVRSGEQKTGSEHTKAK